MALADGMRGRLVAGMTADRETAVGTTTGRGGRQKGGEEEEEEEEAIAGAEAAVYHAIKGHR